MGGSRILQRGSQIRIEVRTVTAPVDCAVWTTADREENKGEYRPGGAGRAVRNGCTRGFHAIEAIP